MTRRRTVEIFSAGCALCTDTIELVKRIACSSCEVTVHDLNDATVATRAKAMGVRTAPAVVIDGQLAECCAGRGPDEAALRAAGVGRSL